MRPFLLLPLHPVRAMDELRHTPRWLVAFTVIAAGMLALRLASHSHLVDSTLAALPASATEADKAWARSLLDSELLLRCLAIPLRLFAGMGIFAYFLFMLCIAFDPPVRARFKQVLALEIHAEIINAVGAWVSFAVVMVGSNPSLLTSAKFFTLWYVAALAVGVHVVFGYSKLKASLLAATAWIVSVLFNNLLLESVSASMHFRV